MKRWGSLILLIATLFAASPSFADPPAKPKATLLGWARRMLGGLFRGSQATNATTETKVEPIAKAYVPAKPIEKAYVPPKPIEYRGKVVLLPVADGSKRSYRLGKELGHGKWSVTHEGVDTISGEQVAIKLTKPSRLDVGHIDTFREEAERLGKLNHPNIMTTRGVGKLEGTSQRALVMDYVPGETVGKLFGTRVKTPREEVIAITMKIIEGAEAMHAVGMVHKSLHVGNVMYEPGETIAKSSVKIIDLGGSKEMSKEYTPHRDWKDIGALLAFMLTGEKGYRGGQWTDLGAALSVLPDITIKQNKKVLHLKDVILKATQEDAAKGFSSGKAFRDALKPFLQTQRWKIAPRS